MRPIFRMRFVVRIENQNSLFLVVASCDSKVNFIMELLISEVQKRIVLWNKWDKKYRDRIIADKEWDEVAKMTKMKSTYCIFSYL